MFASEIDKYAKTSYAALYGTDHLHGDITKITANDVPDHDVMAGGFPCQAFSIAGKRKGFEDTRGTLFFEIARVAKEKQPKAIFLENVKGLLSHDKGRTIEVILQTLNEIGYIVDFHVLNTKYFGLPQNRERIFIIALRKDIIKPEKWEVEGSTIETKTKRRLTSKINHFSFLWPNKKIEVPTLGTILEQHVNPKYYVKKERKNLLLSKINERNKINITKEISHICTKNNITPVIDANYTKGTSPTNIEKNLSRRACVLELPAPTQFSVEGKGIAYCLDTGYPNSLGPSKVNKGARTHVLELKNNQNIEKISFDDCNLRKLTPLECWRLQGFTDAQFYKAKKALNETHYKGKDRSDSQLYKQAGNAVSVPVIQAIGEKLIQYL